MLQYFSHTICERIPVVGNSLATVSFVAFVMLRLNQGAPKSYGPERKYFRLLITLAVKRIQFIKSFFFFFYSPRIATDFTGNFAP